MEIFQTHEARNNFLKLVLKIILVLAGIQFLRVILFGVLSAITQPLVLLHIIWNGLSFIIVGMILLIYFKPSLNDLGLGYDSIGLRTRILYITGFSVLSTLILSQYISEWELSVLIFSMVFGIITPVFEELLFRGYIWSKLNESDGIISPDILTFLTVTLLFGVWQLGYIDFFIRNPVIMGNAGMLITLKIGISLVLGLIVGFLRFKSDKTYASIIIHGLWNIFEP
ncbi:MAG: CPBP family intramembrane metalloprotease [Methanobacterium sp.]|nr:CPBP family intramembrane metalloprotease [Methanobacterium sp.]